MNAESRLEGSHASRSSVVNVASTSDGSGSSFAEHAHRYSELGWALIRVDGKKPVGRDWQQTQPMEPGDAAGAWSHWGEKFNMGVVLRSSGLVDVEADSDEAAVFLTDLLDREGIETPIAFSGRGLPHVFFRDPGGLTRCVRDGLELRVGAHQSVVPPSTHASTGKPYIWEVTPWDVPLAGLPDSLLDYFQPTRSNGRGHVAIGDVIVEGRRNDELASLAGAMRRRGATEDEIRAALLVANKNRCQPPLDDAEVERIAASLSRYEPAVAEDVEPDEVPPLDVPVDQVLDEVTAFCRRYVVLSDDQLVAVTLWVAHTHAFDAADTTPYLAITSAEKQCGKTRLLEVLQLLVAKPWLTGGVSAAALTRKVHQDEPTLLLDESDATFKGDKEYAERLRGVLNHGYRRGGKVSVCEPSGKSFKMVDLSSFCPKAIAGIGRLPDTVADRSISIRLKRRTRDEVVEKLRERDARAVVEPIVARLASFAAESIDVLQVARPDMPDGLSDRAEDVWEPLLAIADLAGDGWPERAREAAVGLSGERDPEEDSLGVRLLADIKHVFDARPGTTRIFTRDLIGALAGEDGPWTNWKGSGNPISTYTLSAILSDYGIKPTEVRIGTEHAKGYKREQFDDAFTRYLHSEPRHPRHPSNHTALPMFESRDIVDDVAALEMASNPHEQSDVADVAASRGGYGEDGVNDDPGPPPSELLGESE